eukprot:scpid65696/ scgid7173/ Alpha-parvin; Actopaxin
MSYEHHREVQIPAGARRRSSLTVTQIDLPSPENDFPPEPPKNRRRFSGSLSVPGLPFSTGSLRKSRSGSMNIPRSTSATLQVNDASLRKTRSGSLHLPTQVTENNNPYLLKPRRSIAGDSGVRRLSAQDLALIQREVLQTGQRLSAAAVLQRAESSPSSSPAAQRRQQEEEGRSSFSSAGSTSASGSRSNLDVMDGPGSASGTLRGIRKSISANSFASSVSRFLATTLMGSELEEEVKSLDVETRKVMDYNSEEQCRRMAEDGELIIWDPETGVGDMMAPGTMKKESLRQLVKALAEWINDVLQYRRVVVLDIFQDLYDGQVLDELMEVLLDEHRAATTDSFCIAERLKKERLRRVLVWIDSELGHEAGGADEDAWNVERIWQQDMIATMHLLIALNRHFTAQGKGPASPIPENVAIEVHRNEIDPISLRLVHKKWREHLTGIAGLSLASTSPLPRQADVFDKFFVEAPQKIVEAEQVLLKFANLHLCKLSFQQPLTDFHEDFRDGVSIVMLLSILGGFCIRFHELRLPVEKDDDRANNLLLAFRLMRDASIEHPGVDRPDDIIQGCPKATMRVLFPIFKLYKHAV